MYHNLGDGRFERITDHLLVEDTKPSRAAIWSDLNGDSITDLFVANEENSSNDIFWVKVAALFERLNRAVLP
ncbi:MAG: VCBS repeat-containing protein [Saprospiraceae bacterium]